MNKDLSSGFFNVMFHRKQERFLAQATGLRLLFTFFIYIKSM